MSTPPSKKTCSQKLKATLENRYLPDDVLCNIFTRLPAKMLAQMKSLSKPWNALISHPYFIKSHLRCSIHNHHEILVFIDGAFSYNEPLKFTARSSQSPHIELTDFIKPPPLVTTNKHKHPQFNEVIGSVNGLICFSADTCIHVWNPSLSALIDIPPYTIRPLEDDYVFIFRFGFDPKNDDYKVFKATIWMFEDGYMDTETLQVEVYSIRKGLWESISVRIPSHITIICCHNDVAVDGHDGRLHWICVAHENDDETILAFDLGVETFTEILLPDSIRFGVSNYVGVLSQKLCVFSLSRTVEGDCDVWVMNTYGVAKSWVKHHVLKQRVNGSIFPLGFTPSNELLFNVNDDDLALFDPNADVVKSFKIRNTTTVTTLFYHGIKIVPYVDSLVWPFKRVPSLQPE